MNRLALLVLMLALFYSCKPKKNKEEKNFFSVTSYIQAQVKGVDTSLYRITKIEKTDSTTDTAIISREDFSTYARDFLNLPDISSGDRKDNYEESSTYDPDLKSILLTYTAKDDEEAVRREIVMLDPDNPENAQVRTILVNELRANKDSSVEKDMTWHVDSHFQVVTKSRKPGENERIRTLLVKWE